MKRLLVALLALGGGCWYDRPNPWDTSDDVEAYLEKVEADWALELKEPYDYPQTEPLSFVDPELEAWRDTVLANADPDTLVRIGKSTRARLGALIATRAEFLKVDPINRESELTAIEDRIRTETIRLALVTRKLKPKIEE